MATTSAGTPIDKDNLERSVRTLCRQIDIPAITPYELRHTAITHQIEAGWTANQVAEWAGTSVRTIYQHYRHKLAEISELQHRTTSSYGYQFGYRRLI